jgi:uncharacterized protein (DUF1330 family)
MEIERTTHPGGPAAEVFSREQVSRKPIVMVNLLRFRRTADYAGTGTEAEPTSGEHAYERYGRAVLPLLWREGGQILWAGNVRTSFIAPSYERWDRAVLVHYPSRAAFLRMVSSEDYERAAVHRTAALEDSRLLETHATRLPRIPLAASRLAVHAWTRLRRTVR